MSRQKFLEGLMEDCLDPDVLREHVPRMDAVLDGAETLRMLHEETKGFTVDRNMQSIAKINVELMITLEELHNIDCTCGNPVFGAGGDRSWFLKWLNTPWGQAFKTKH